MLMKYYEQIMAEQNNIGVLIDRLSDPDVTPDYVMTHMNFVSLVNAVHHWSKKLCPENPTMANSIASFRNQCEAKQKSIEIHTGKYVKNAMKDRRGTGITQSEFKPQLKSITGGKYVRDTEPS